MLLGQPLGGSPDAEGGLTEPWQGYFSPRLRRSGGRRRKWTTFPRHCPGYLWPAPGHFLFNLDKGIPHHPTPNNGRAGGERAAFRNHQNGRRRERGEKTQNWGNAQETVDLEAKPTLPSVPMGPAVSRGCLLCPSPIIQPPPPFSAILKMGGVSKPPKRYF